MPNMRVPRWLPASLVVVAALVAAFAFIPPLQTLAQDPFGLFRVKRFATVTIDPSTLPSTRPDPSAFGAVTITQMPKLASAASIKEAQAMVDFAILTPRDLPAGMGGPSRIEVSKEGHLSYTIDLAKLRQYLASAGISAIGLPASLDGATIELSIPSQVLIDYGPTSATGPALMVSQGRSPTVQAPAGLDVDLIRQQLLSMPGIPPEVAAQLKSVDDWQHTAVIPLPKDGIVSQKFTMPGGIEALRLQDKGGGSLAVLWQRDGIVYAMAGSMPADRLLAAAASMSP